jgi:hypothetical protein
MAQQEQQKPQAQTISFLDVLRRNRVGALVSGLVVMFAAALLLSAAVPDDLNIVIALLPDQGAWTLVTAAVLAGIGTPILLVTGSSTESFGDALLSSLASEYLSVAAALAAIAAAICAGWGKR